ISCLAVVVCAIAIKIERQRRNALQRYWERKCTGSLWKLRFPESSSAAIRAFLDMFTTAFMLPGREFQFSPDDKVLEIYRALYPHRALPDALELESLANRVAEQYGVDLKSKWRDNMTLGELYAETQAL